ncbi:MAG: ArsR/SmtB family transcription factor [Tractidigestivibacter sp.]|jgi:ArsR family transcriptional regulator|uniref:ArsR/SmtB family transcription factor n=1 Tax=Tractidigestivibacter sp. TaxID=2847320 RepID=UPI003D918DBA
MNSQSINQLASELEQAGQLLNALGDRTRQYLIMVMMKSGNCMGLRVGDIAAKTSLSRPAVSHHLQIMKKAGLIKVRKEGTKNYYYFDETSTALDQLIQTLIDARNAMRQLPDRAE